MILAAVLCMEAAAQTHLRERVFLSTDKGVYVAGDRIWLSAYCADVNTGSLSGFSSVAYVELHSAEGLAQTAKLVLHGGRGSGSMTIPNTVPTGNYKLIGYTAQCCNEEGFDFAADARAITIYNTLSTERVEGGIVEASDAPAADPAAVSNVGSVVLGEVSASGNVATLSLRNDGDSPVSLNVSVFHNDGIPAPADGGIASFARNVRNLPAAKAFTLKMVPEFEGEIIDARVSGTSSSELASLEGNFAYLSVPGDKQNVYTSRLDGEGNVRFYTSGIYGDKDMFLEIQDLPDGKVCHLELVSPFVNAEVGEIAPLKLDDSHRAALEKRSMGMQLEKIFDVDTLYSQLPLWEHVIFDKNTVRYILDDYTRFNVMEELFIEFIQELRVRNVNGVRTIQVRVRDGENLVFASSGESLLLLDGVPVLDQQKILDYDPLLVKHIDIYPDSYSFGVKVFNGVVNFVTYKNNLASMKFEDNVRIVNFQGLSYPLAYTCEGVGNDYPDYRQTIYWNPSVTIAPGETVELKCKTPAYGGRFDIVAEGLSEKLEPVHTAGSFYHTL